MSKVKSREQIEKKFIKALQKLRDEHLLSSMIAVMPLMEYDEGNEPHMDEEGRISQSLQELIDTAMAFGNTKPKAEFEKLKAKMNEELAELEAREKRGKLQGKRV